MVTAFQYGATAIIPVSTIKEAKAYKADGFLAGGERNGEVVDGFAFGNSPFSYMSDEIKGREIALTTTNGTRAIAIAAKQADSIAIGAFLNLSALAQWLIPQGKDVIILCAGWKDRFNRFAFGKRQISIGLRQCQCQQFGVPFGTKKSIAFPCQLLASKTIKTSSLRKRCGILPAHRPYGCGAYLQGRQACY
jgi:hypothetical protein